MQATYAKSCSSTFVDSLLIHQRRPFEIPPFPHCSTVDIFRSPLQVFLVLHPVSYCHFQMDSQTVLPYGAQRVQELNLEKSSRGLHKCGIKITLIEYVQSNSAIE